VLRLKLLERLGPGANRRLGREHEARQAEVPPGGIVAKTAATIVANLLRRLDLVDPAGPRQLATP
jgi:hypothetical protein